MGREKVMLMDEGGREAVSMIAKVTASMEKDSELERDWGGHWSKGEGFGGDGHWPVS